MPAKNKKTNLLILLPMPLSPPQLAQKQALLAEALKTTTREQLIVQELGRIYTWRTMKDSPLKRLYKNYSLAYSLPELRLFLASNMALLIKNTKNERR
jgi:hypothetical protein